MNVAHAQQNKILLSSYRQRAVFLLLNYTRKKSPLNGGDKTNTNYLY